MASLPIVHPLHDVFRKRAKRYIKSHRSPLHELGLLLGIDPGRLETLDPVCHPPTHELKANISADGPSDDAMAEDLNGTNCTEIQLYSDGSTIDGKVGAAAVMYREGQEVKSLRFHLGSADEHTVFEAEAVGVILSLHLLSYERDSRNASITAICK